MSWLASQNLKTIVFVIHFGSLDGPGFSQNCFSSYLLSSWPRCFRGGLLGDLLQLPLVADEARDEDGDDGDEGDDDEQSGESGGRQTDAINNLARVLHSTLK